MQSIFSSSLVQAQPKSSEGQETRLVVASEFWIYVVVTAPLVALTMGFTLLVNARLQKTALP
jgi:hypothetical protein